MISAKDRKLRHCILPMCKGKRFDLVHKFPMDNERAEIWRDILNIPELNQLSLDHIRKRYFICSQHFPKTDYKNCESRSLNKTAYPRLHLTVDSCNVNSIVENNAKSENTESVEVLNESHPLENIIIFQNNTDDSMQLPNLSDQFINTSKAVTASPAKSENVELNTPHLRLGKRVLLKPQTQKILVPIHVKTKPNDIVKLKRTQIKRGANLANPKKKSTFLLNVNNCDNINLQNVNILSDVEVDLIHLPLEPQSTEELIKSISENFVDPTSNDFLSITHLSLSKPLKLNNFWLRDQCRCSECYTNSSQHRINLLDIPSDVKPIYTAIDGNNINVQWSDQHESTYNIIELNKMQYNAINEGITLTLWQNLDIETFDYARVTLNDYLCDESVAHFLVESLIKYGCAFIEKVPPNLQSTEVAIKRLFPVQKTSFGEMWSTTDTQDHCDCTNCDQRLLVHNDHTYFNDAAGLRVVHCIGHTGGGGEMTLIDGFKVAQNFSEMNPEAYDYLCKTSVPSEYVKEDCHYKYSAPIINLDAITTKPQQIRFNMNQRAPLNTVSQFEMANFYKSFRSFASELFSPQYEWKFKLNPGTVCIIDNWRILHGRTEYTGKRQMVGCYVARNEFLNVARTMGFTV